MGLWANNNHNRMGISRAYQPSNHTPKSQRREIHNHRKKKLGKESDIPNLPYLQAIVKETLRLHPTGLMIVHESIADSKIDGYDIRARIRVFVNVWATGRDPDHWPEPLDFKPERFTESDRVELMLGASISTCCHLMWSERLSGYIIGPASYPTNSCCHDTVF